MPAQYTFRLSLAAISVIGRHLSRGVYAEVAPIIADLQQQVNEQEAAEKAASEDPAAVTNVTALRSSTPGEP